MARSEELQEALVLPIPQNPGLVLDGCRRLLGPNLYGPEPGAVGDCLVAGHDRDEVLALWSGHVRHFLGTLGLPQAGLRLRPFDGGGSLYFPAPVDQLFTAAYVIEAAWYLTATGLLGLSAMAPEALATELTRISAMERSPDLAALVAEVARRGIDRLLDDDALTLGHGAGSATWATDALPGSPDWARLHDIPLALVTGTNGKTTTTRLIAAMGAAAGKVSGLSSTEFVKVGDEVLDRGDYSGPAGARLLLRDKRLEVGVLEVARGGILRRGLPVTRARAAVVTNVAADHLGQYGITTVPELAEVKLSVHRALAPGGQLILNADDPMVVEAAGAPRLSPVWFSLGAGSALIRAARAAALPCGWLADGMIHLSDGAEETALVAVEEVPLTLGGAARYNIENALAAALAARALGLPDTAIRKVLTSFRSDPTDNPGRANEFAVKGARVFVDFAHNPHSIAAITSALAALPAKRRFALITHAGDRSDEDIAALTRGLFALRPDIVVAAENPKYLRGRAPGEVPALIRRACRDCGLPDDNILSATSPADGAGKIVAHLQPGDLALLLVHDERAAIFDLLRAAPSPAA
ncbi:Mur ligase family protein [Frigidibacter sp. SD6-1]|uniref:Mur ligase family protein n=1 Tax=Frigidibacter sp. SD6-1 TaxID=3032581 RepID=UPI0024DFD014|nr:Mur ligase family protein [Frigidibacter sp. SD6-1]